MKTLPARDVPEAEAEAPFRAPEALALAMPLVAVFGLVAVVSAVALGATGRVVALLAVAGFGLCALAPMALIEAFVSRPLRGALAQLRAARDGLSPRGPAYASGVLADLVHIARDLQAAQANGNVGFPPPDFAAAHQEAARALVEQAVSLAEAAEKGESQINRTAQACFADIAQAIKSMRDAPVVAGFDGAVERLESMLVYIAETQERAETKDRQFEGAFGRVEVGMADLARLVARETDTVQGALSSHGLLARNDMADAVAQQKSGRARVLERLDTLESRLTKGADGVSRDVAKLAETIRAEAGRRTSGAAGEGRLDDIAAALSRLETEIRQARTAPAVPAELSGLGAAVARLADDFAAREPVEPALRALSESLAAQLSEADLTGLRAQMRETARAVEALRAPAPAERDESAPQAADLARQLAEIGARLDAFQADERAQDLALAARGLIETAARLEAQWTQGLPAELNHVVTRGLTAFGERLDAQGEADAGRFDALGARMEESLQALASAAVPDTKGRDGRAESPPPEVFARATETLGALTQRLEAVLAQRTTEGQDGRHLAETLKSALAAVAARTELAAQRQGEKLDEFAERMIDPARDALAGAARDFAAVRARFEAGEPVLARVEEATQGARARLDALVASLPGAFALTVEAQVERLVERLDAAALAPARDAFAKTQAALADAATSFGSAQGRLVEGLAARHADDASLAARATADLARQIDDLAQAMRAQTAEGFLQAQASLAELRAKIEAGDPSLADVASATAQWRQQIDGLAATLQAQGEDLAARLDAGALAPAREALAQAAEGFATAQGRLSEATARIEAGDPRLAAAVTVATNLRQQIDGLAATLAGQGEDLANRFDAGALAPAREALAQAAEGFVTAQGRLSEATARIEAGDPRLTAVATNLRQQIDGLAATLTAQGEDLGARLDAGALAPAREALAQAAEGFVTAQGRLSEATARIEAGDPRLTAVATNLRQQIDGLAATLAGHSEDLGARFDAGALAPAREALRQAAEGFVAAQARLSAAADRIEAGDPRWVEVAAASHALRGDFAAWAQSLPEALSAHVGAAGLDPARAALVEAERAFDAARVRLDDGCENLGRLRGDFVASEARFARLLEDTVARWASLGFERLPDLVDDLAATQAQWRTQIAEFDRSALVLSRLADTDARDVAALRDAFARAERDLGSAIASLAPGFETAAAAQGDRIAQALATRDREGARELEGAIARVGDLHATLERARAPEALDALRVEVTASAQTVARGLDESVQTLARQIEDRLEGLRRGEFAPAALALQASTQDLGKAHAELFGQVSALKTTLGVDRAAFAALRLDVVQALANVAAIGEGAEAAMRAAAERTEVLSQNVGALVGAERTELAAVAQALARIGERVEYAARSFEDRRGGDLTTLFADLTREIDALARATAERVLALEGGVETLAHAAGATLSQLREATRALSGVGLEEIVRRLDPLAALPDLTRDLRALVAQASVERPQLAQGTTAPDGADPSGPSAAVSHGVLLAGALDARFSQIEAALADVSARLIGEDPDGLDAEVAALATQLNAASQALKSGLSAFVGASAARVEDMSARAAETAPAPTASFAGISGP